MSQKPTTRREAPTPEGAGSSTRSGSGGNFGSSGDAAPSGLGEKVVARAESEAGAFKSVFTDGVLAAPLRSSKTERLDKDVPGEEVPTAEASDGEDEALDVDARDEAPEKTPRLDKDVPAAAAEEE